ncbi:hypothetical protein EV715DRAFT_213467, partial [Schizophyllum commune]
IAMHGRDCEELSAFQRSVAYAPIGRGRRARGETPDTAAHATRNVESRPTVLRQFPNPATNRLLPSSFEPRPFWRQTDWRVSNSTQIVGDYSGRLLDGRQQRTALGDGRPESLPVPSMARAPASEGQNYRKSAKTRIRRDDSNRERTLSQHSDPRTEGEATDEGHAGDKPR